MCWLVPALVLMVGVAQSQTPVPTLTRNSDDQRSLSININKYTAADPHGAENAPVFVKPLPSELASEPPGNDTENNKNGRSSEPFIDLISLIITTIATAIIATFTVRLWWSTEKLWQETKSASAIAKQSADAAKKSADITQRIEAATLALKLSPVITVANNIASIDLNIELINVGRSIAGEISIRFTIYDVVGANGAYAAPGEPDAPVASPSRHGEILLAGEKRMITHGLQRSNWDNVLSREQTYIVHIDVSYRDIFGLAHVLPACYYYDHRAKNLIRCPIAPQMT